MKMTYHIQEYCCIKEGRIALNGKTVFIGEANEFPVFIKAAYKHFDVDYGKFFKMDALSKLAFMGAEILLKNEDEKNTALVLTNKAGSLDTDRKHQATMQEYPSPAVFVYTLPNICLGEISIKHQLYSENAFFVCDNFKAETIFEYSSALIDAQKAEKVLCGWVDMDNGKYDAFLYIVSKNGTFEHSIKNLNRLYQTHE